ncbi:membrane protein of uknown function UCP014873 [Beutenbergia cavernae DSM 12333]|uniref:Membrane protein of uknown function UCP014873 n=1 Tax=Beutenbergia cavernae (strain ATCC BAA-8 / DSM 12333 / CCUG 43141 / JCM 11478 / NBRC 16432 / NCIMB 13614 / HKI 0122) TaxID=471853 RepID=C5C5V0_BEUC1|nr:DUF1269 domain-containing protein [Beutenbergia cavernae]ACQ82308.1 membrane protein of uknown function UCP014873 [Beutenbergia cavernae DSM 12333]
MTTFTVWKFDTPEGANGASDTLKAAASDGLVRVVDSAIVSWPADAKAPKTVNRNEDSWRGTGWGAFWGLLFGTLFFVPFLGAAVGAAAGAISKAVGAVGINDEQLEEIRTQVTPGTSALFVVTENADTDRLGERFRGHAKLIATNLTDAEEKVLLETFGA